MKNASLPRKKMKEQTLQENFLQFLRFPFLGTRRDGEPFAYLLTDVSQDKANIVISKWMVNYTTLNLEERVDLFIPSLLAIEYSFRNNVPGVVTSVQEDLVSQEYLYEVKFIHPLSIQSSEQFSLEQFTRHLPTDTSLIEMLLRLIKDSLILKQGIRVYLKHLGPYFSRISNYPIADYADLEEVIFVDIANKIKKNEDLLENLYHSITKTIKSISDISIFINLDELRESVESEISLDLFMVIFSDVTSRDKLIKLLSEPNLKLDYNQHNKYMTYMLAIKELEKRLYSNYNQIVLIYLKSLSS